MQFSQQNRVALYSVFLVGSIVLGISFFNLLPNLYYYCFSFVKQYLEKRAEPAPLTVTVYHEYDQLFFTLKLVIIAFGLFMYFRVGEKKISSVVQSFFSLGWPINLRIVFITSLIFIVTTLPLIFHFAFKLLALTEGAPTPIPKGFNPLKMVFKTAGMFPIAKTFWAQGQNLYQAQIIFNQINTTSYILYMACHNGAVCSTIWFIWWLQDKMKRAKHQL